MDEKQFQELLSHIKNSQVGCLNLENYVFDTVQELQFKEAIHRNSTITEIQFGNANISPTIKKEIEEIIYNPIRQFLIGWMLDKGHLETKLNSEALSKQIVQCYQRAANDNYTEAQYNLAVMYLMGEHVEQSDVKALEWCKKSQKLKISQFMLGWMTLHGRGIVQNVELGLSLISSAAEYGVPLAQIELGKIYTKGDIVITNLNLARQWYQKAAVNDPEGDFMLGQYAQAAEKGHAYSNWKLAEAFRPTDIHYIYPNGVYGSNLNTTLMQKESYRRVNDTKTTDENFRRQQCKFSCRKASTLGVVEAQYEFFCLGINNKLKHPHADLRLKTESIYQYSLPSLIEEAFCKEKNYENEYIFWGLEAVKKGYEPAYKQFCLLTATLSNNKVQEEIEGLLKKYFEEGRMIDEKRKRKLNLPNFVTKPNHVTLSQQLLSYLNENNFQSFFVILNSPSLIPFMKAKAFMEALKTKKLQVAEKMLLSIEDIDIHYFENGKDCFTLALTTSPAIAEKIVDYPGFNINHELYPLACAAVLNAVAIVKKLLSKPGIKINGMPEGRTDTTALWCAAGQGNNEIVSLLLEHPEVDVNRECSTEVLSEEERSLSNGKDYLTAEEFAYIRNHENIVLLIQHHRERLALRVKLSESKYQSDIESSKNSSYSALDLRSTKPLVPSSTQTLAGRQTGVIDRAQASDNNKFEINTLQNRVQHLEELCSELCKKLSTQENFATRLSKVEELSNLLLQKVEKQQVQNMQLSQNIKELTFLVKNMSVKSEVSTTLNPRPVFTSGSTYVPNT